MVALVTLEKTKQGLRVDSSDDDDMLEMLIEVASDAVIAYLKGQAAEVIELDRLTDSPADDEAVPMYVQYATILQVDFYYGGDRPKADEPGSLCEAAERLLYSKRDPALA